MASTSDIAKRYFAALAAHDLAAATALWEPGAVDQLVGGPELIAPHGIEAYFAALFAAFPDFALEILELTTYRDRTAVRWRATGTFAGPASFQGFAPNGARIAMEGCDVVRVRDDKIYGNDAYLDSGAIARQLGFLPPTGSPAEARLAGLANLGTRLRDLFAGAGAPEPIADGVWILRGGFPGRHMSVFLIADGDGVAVFDAGISAMGPALAAAVAGLGGATRVILGHADCDHRGAAPSLGAPVYCHPLEAEAATSPDAFRPYWDLRKLPAPVRAPYRRLLLPSWDGGAVTLAGTVEEDDEIAGFRVVALPGHAPGLIGLVREDDGLALVSDCFYTLDVATGAGRPPQIPHPAFNLDSAQAGRSIAKLAALELTAAWPGHAQPVTGDVRGQLQRAAAGLV